MIFAVSFLYLTFLIYRFVNNKLRPSPLKHSEQFKGYSKTELEHFYLCIEACLAGLGVTLVSTYMIEREIKHQLLQPMSSIYQDESAYFLLSAEPFEEDVRKVLFCDWLRGQMQASQLE